MDNDCDGVVDEGVSDGSTVYYLDSDGDGYGVVEDSVTSCAPPEGYSTDSGDCDDTDVNTYPGAPELCDDVQNDCDGLSSSEGLATFIPLNGPAQDITAQFTPNGSQEFLSVGEYHFCGATFPASITVGASASICSNQ